MFVRPCWRPTSPQDAIEIIDRNPWALLVSNGEDVPFATNLPLAAGADLIKSQTAKATQFLIGHIARGNEHAHALAIHNARSAGYL